MEISILLIQQILQLFLMILAGWALGRAGIVNKAGSKVISQVILYLVMPCVTLNAFQKEVNEQAVQGLMFAAGAEVVAHIVMAIVMVVSTKLFSLS